MIGFGFVKDWKALVGLRLILGILEVRDASITNREQIILTAHL